MKKTMIAVVILVLMAGFAWAEMTATVEDGRKALLKDDGTWEWVKETGPPQGDQIAAYKGSGGKTCRPFETKGPWEVKWDAQGDLFQIFLFKGDGDLVGVLANQMESGKGDSYQPTAGRYYIQVNAMGRWKIEVVPVQ